MTGEKGVTVDLQKEVAKELDEKALVAFYQGVSAMIDNTIGKNAENSWVLDHERKTKNRIIKINDGLGQQSKYDLYISQSEPIDGQSKSDNVYLWFILSEGDVMRQIDTVYDYDDVNKTRGKGVCLHYNPSVGWEKKVVFVDAKGQRIDPPNSEVVVHFLDQSGSITKVVYKDKALTLQEYLLDYIQRQLKRGSNLVKKGKGGIKIN